MTRILCNSWPKAGTHALLELARLVLGEGAWYRDPDIKYPAGDEEFVAKAGERLARNAGRSLVIKGHFGYSARLAGFLAEHDFRHLFAVRDPREVICSTYRWLNDLRPNWEISRFLASLGTAEQIERIITGLPVLPPFHLDHAIRWDRPLAERYAALTAWLDTADVCVLSYEEMTGMLGMDRQREAIERALTFIGVPFAAADPGRIATSICNPQASTFHTGPASDWTKLFTDRHRQLFVETGGEVLIERLGYAPTVAASAGSSP
jgi:hypothetical protein